MCIHTTREASSSASSILGSASRISQVTWTSRPSCGSHSAHPPPVSLAPGAPPPVS